MQSFNALWSDEVKAEGTSRVTWDIEQVEDSCRLTVTHDQLREGANGELYGGWPMILSGLKTLLETGEQLTTPGLAPVIRQQHVRLDRQLDAPRARLAGEPLVDLPRARLELHLLRVPSRSEVPLVGRVRVERGERVRRVGSAAGLKDGTRPSLDRVPAGRARRAAEEQPAAARQPEPAQHVGRPFHPGHDHAAGIRVRVEQEPERDLVESLRRRRAGLAGPLHGRR